MTSLTNRPNAWESTVPLREAMNSLFEQSFLSPSWNTVFGRATTSGCALDVYEDNENYYVLGVLPGVDPSKVEIVAQENTLLIAGELPSFVPQGKQVVWQELPTGAFRRTLALPTPFEAGKIEAHYEGGLLKLVVPKAEYARMRKIAVRSPQGQLSEGQPGETTHSTTNNNR